MPRPLCYIDFDGVLNAEKPSPDWPDWETYLYKNPLEEKEQVYKLTYSRAMVQELLALDLDFVWLTQWGKLANEFLEPLLGMPRMYSFLEEENYHPVRWWKREVVLTSRVPFIWLDDCIRNKDLGWDKKTNTILHKDFRGHKHLALSMNAEFGRAGRNGLNQGLKRSDLALIQAWADVLKESA